MAKKKRQGHYCRICGEYKANEKFSGKGHAQHICKACMSKKKKGHAQHICKACMSKKKKVTMFASD